MNAKLKTVTIAGIIVVFAAIVFVLSQIRPQKDFSYKGPVEPVTIGVVGDTSFLVLYAQEKELFMANGLGVEIVKYTVGAQALEDLINKEVDVAVGADYIGVLNRFENNSFKVVAEVAKTNAYEVVARTDLGIQDPMDLKGKRFGVTKGTAGDYWLGVFMRSNRLKEGDFEIVNLRPAEIQEALIAGDIVAGLNLEPHTSNTKEALSGNTVSWHGERGQGIYSLLYVSQEMIDQQPAVVSRLVESVLKAREYYVQNRQEGLDFLQNYFNHSDKYMEEVVIPKYSFDVGLSEALLLTMEDQARWMIGNGLTKESAVPNYLDLTYFWPLDSLRPGAVTIIH